MNINIKQIIKNFRNYKFQNIPIRTKFLYIYITLSLSVIIFYTVSSINSSFNILQLVREQQIDHISRFFKGIDKRISYFVTEDATLEGVSNLISAYNTLKIDKISKKDEENLTTFYKSEYLYRLNLNLIKKQNVDPYIPASNKTKLLQLRYIIDNPNPVGSKHLLHKSTISNDAYDTAHSKHYNVFDSFKHKNNLYDILLFNRDGDIVYTYSKEVDFGTELNSTLLKTSVLQKTFTEINTKIQNMEDNETKTIKDFKYFSRLVDLSPYLPSYNSSTMFILAPIIKNNKYVGVLAFQIDPNDYNSILTFGKQWKEKGLGNTGESFLLGQDLVKRSQSRYFIEHKNDFLNSLIEANYSPHLVALMDKNNTDIAIHKLPSKGIYLNLFSKKAEKGVKTWYKDTFDRYCFLTYRSFNVFEGVKWVLITRFSFGEVFAPVVYCILFIIILCYCIDRFYINKVLVEPLSLVMEYMEKFALGNLDLLQTNEVNAHNNIKVQKKKDQIFKLLVSKDEMGKLLYSFTQAGSSMKSVIVSIKEAAEQVKESSHKFIVASNIINSNLTTQSSSVSEMTASVEELNAGIDNLSVLYNKQNEFYSKLLGVIEKISIDMEFVGKELDNTCQIIKKSKDASENGSNLMIKMDSNMGLITEQSHKMIDIINIIRDISDQINLLSLNANIESALAGESGHSFAVVAKEISELSDRTANSIKSITTLIKSSSNLIQQGAVSTSNLLTIFKHISENVILTNESVNSFVKLIQEQLKLSKDSLKELAQSKNITLDIQNSMSDHKQALGGIVETISLLNTAAQDILSEVDKLSESAKSLNSVNTTLVTEISYFKINS